MNTLVSRFAGAGLDLRLADAPFAGGLNAASIFQLDIRRARAHDVRSEHFLAWTGAKETLAVVQAADRRERQVVLAVREGATEFEEALPRWVTRSIPYPAGSMEWKRAVANRAGPTVSAAEVVARSGGASIVRFTTASTRHMLVGRDERQLFMCELPRPCTSIRDAHDALRSPAARSRSRSALDRPVRQGEWFFIVGSAFELTELDAAIAGNRVVVRRKTGINAFIPRTGKPHIADEIVRTPEGRVYVRGAIRHPDHKTIHFHQWRQVVRNLEVDRARSPLGGTWMD